MWLTRLLCRKAALGDEIGRVWLKIVVAVSSGRIDATFLLKQKRWGESMSSIELWEYIDQLDFSNRAVKKHPARVCGL